MLGQLASRLRLSRADIFKPQNTPRTSILTQNIEFHPKHRFSPKTQILHPETAEHAQKRATCEVRICTCEARNRMQPMQVQTQRQRPRPSYLPKILEGQPDNHSLEAHSSLRQRRAPPRADSNQSPLEGAPEWNGRPVEAHSGPNSGLGSGRSAVGADVRRVAHLPRAHLRQSQAGRGVEGPSALKPRNRKVKQITTVCLNGQRTRQDSRPP